jgi:hypothetical protein
MFESYFVALFQFRYLFLKRARELGHLFARERFFQNSMSTVCDSDRYLVSI